jgi:hypothetical protein
VTPEESIMLVLLSGCCSLAFFLPFVVAIVILARWQVLQTVAVVQSRLEGWATENGYRIERQERPEKPPLADRGYYWYSSIFLSSNCPWVPNLERRGFWKSVATMSTLVTVVDSERRPRRGRMRYDAVLVGPFRAAWEAHREELAIPPPESVNPEPRNDPLWDPWIDAPGAG